jgi:hypothetical protein
MTAFANGHPEAAIAPLERARVRYEVSYSDAHPRRAMVRCVSGAALIAAGRRQDGEALITPACDQYARWGLADPTVVAWGRSARSP